MSALPTLTIIGGGKVGKTLGYLLAKNACYQVQDILCRSLTSSREASQFIGSGRAIEDYQNLVQADAYLIAVTDDQLPNAIDKLALTGRLKSNSLVFHCSGALPSTLLGPLKRPNILTASVHPIKSFSNPSQDIHRFQNTVCTVEGDLEACKILEEKFTRLGAKVTRITSSHKLSYHAALVFSCNYFVTLMDTALSLFESAGIARKEGIAMLEPLVMGAWQQIKESDTADALTGPISRGDSDLVGAQLRLLTEVHPNVADAYRALGRLTLQLAEQKQSLTTEEIQNLTTVLVNNP